VAAKRTLASMKTQVRLDCRLDAIQLAYESIALVSPGLDQLLEGETLLPQDDPDSVERLRNERLPKGNDHAVRRFRDGNQIALLQTQPLPDRGGEGDLAIFLDADECRYRRHGDDSGSCSAYHSPSCTKARTVARAIDGILTR
jgi:hypothetical protein